MEKNLDFKFVEHKLIKLDYLPNSKFDDATNSIEISPQLNLNYKFNENRLFVDFSIKFDNLKTPFYLHSVLQGMFEFKEAVSSFDEEALYKLAHINLAAIMFPFIREIISDVTVKAGFAPLLLPPINFVAAYQDKKLIKKPVCTDE